MSVAFAPFAVHTPAPGSNVAYTGSSTEYWALEAAREAARQQEAERLQLAHMIEKEKRRVRKHQRIFTWMYNALAIGELVYFIVGLYIVSWEMADLQDNPLLGPGASGVIKMGGTYTPRIVQDLQYWRLLSSLFYNAGAIHLTANLGLTWAFGHFLVRELSAYAVATIFLFGGLAGMMVSVNVGADYMTAGASIPAFALAGAAATMLIYQWRLFSCHLASAIVVGLMVGVSAFIGATPFVDNSGNTAGLVFGGVMCLGYMLVRRRKSGSKLGETWVYTGAIVATVVVVAALVIGLAGLQWGSPAASCCHEWVCTKSSWWNCEASRIWPTSCTFTSFPYTNQTSILTCPKGETISLPMSAGADQDTVEKWCQTLCMGVAGSPPSDADVSPLVGGGTS